MADPYVYPYGKFLPLRGKVVVVALHPRSRVLHHLFGGVGVDVESEAGRGVAQQVLDALNVRAAGNGNRRRCPGLPRPGPASAEPHFVWSRRRCVGPVSRFPGPGPR